MSDEDNEDYDDEEDEMEEDHFVEDADSHGSGEGSDDDDDDELRSPSGLAADPAHPTSIRSRIDEALSVLGNLKSRGRASSTKSRADIIADLSRDLSEYYGYIQELSDFLLELFSPAECVEYMDASDRNRPLVIRTNTLKTTRKDLMEALGKRGAAVEGIEWSKVAIKVTESTVPIGATPEYLAGHYMLQSAASLNPVMALAPQPNERVLDMSAAPGGKTTYIAQLMKNSGQIIANDLKPARQKATVANLHRMGVKNAIVCCYDGRKIPTIMKGFDRVLLDAPCSGLGVISRDQTVKLQRTVKDIQRIAHMQKELLLAAIDSVDHKSSSGGICVYSTCSISAEENESVVNYALKKRFVRLIETGLEVGKPGFTRHKEKRFHPSLSLTRRFYPHVHNMDGFYVAKLQKFAPGTRGDDDDEDEEEDEEDVEEDDDEDDDDEDGEEKQALPPPKKSKQSAAPAPKQPAPKPKVDGKEKVKVAAETNNGKALPSQSNGSSTPGSVGKISAGSSKGSGDKSTAKSAGKTSLATTPKSAPAAAPSSAKSSAAAAAVGQSPRWQSDNGDDDSDDESDEEGAGWSPSSGAKLGGGLRKKRKRLSLSKIREMNQAAKGKLSPQS